jgi:hypothetical protein
LLLDLVKLWSHDLDLELLHDKALGFFVTTQVLALKACSDVNELVTCSLKFVCFLREVLGELGPSLLLLHVKRLQYIIIHWDDSRMGTGLNVGFVVAWSSCKKKRMKSWLHWGGHDGGCRRRRCQQDHRRLCIVFFQTPACHWEGAWDRFYLLAGSTGVLQLNRGEPRAAAAAAAAAARRRSKKSRKH